MAAAAPAELKPVVRQWHDSAALRAPFDDVWAEFVRVWPKVTGNSPLRDALESSRACPLPDVAKNYDAASVRQLIGLCRYRQHQEGGKPFPLACSAVVELFDVSIQTASNWLAMLIADGVLVLAKKEDRAKRLAREYRYIGG